MSPKISEKYVIDKHPGIIKEKLHYKYKVSTQDLDTCFVSEIVIHIYKTNSEALWSIITEKCKGSWMQESFFYKVVNKVLANYKSEEYKEAIDLKETMEKSQPDLVKNLKTNQGNQRRLLKTLAKEEMLLDNSVLNKKNIVEQISLLEEEIARIKSVLEINRNNKENDKKK
ncbi:hypothetical protein Glove_297g11 [Diversispora epigaea]|uniref:Uncharacterized protein n=2 Tax=Diversispora epigaea TaxID=1348612 RepID=A0A397I1G9_9GLOM|nr:hypothetical protein Glove_297g11 [Diversispora epigaea]